MNHLAEMQDAKLEAAHIRASFNAAIASIQQDDHLAPAGKVERMAYLTLDAQADIRAAERRYLEARSSYRDSMMRRAYGSEGPADASTQRLRRDAAEAAAKLTDEASALELFEWAQLNQDETLARAVALRAHSVGWERVSSEYLADRVSDQHALSELRAVDFEASSPEGQLHYAMRGEFALTLPADLKGAVLSAYERERASRDEQRRQYADYLANTGESSAEEAARAAFAKQLWAA